MAILENAERANKNKVTRHGMTRHDDQVFRWTVDRGTRRMRSPATAKCDASVVALRCEKLSATKVRKLSGAGTGAGAGAGAGTGTGKERLASRPTVPAIH